MNIRQYAKSRAISYESVRKQIRRYQEDLGEHLAIVSGVTQLDDQAVEFLDKHRQPKNVIVAPNDEETKQEIKRLYAEIDGLKDTIIKLQNDKAKYIEDKAKSETLLLIADKEHDELGQTKQELESVRVDLAVSKAACDSLNQANEQLQKEIGTFHRTFFGLYRKA